MKKLYTVANRAEIIGLGINGPLTTPTAIEFKDVLVMLRKGYTLFEHNPFDPSEKVKVTMSNINNITFTRTRSMVAHKRMLNRSIQEMEKNMVVPKITNENKEEMTETFKKLNNKENKNKPVVENTKVEKTSKEEATTDNKVTTPDLFTK